MKICSEGSFSKKLVCKMLQGIQKSIYLVGKYHISFFNKVWIVYITLQTNVAVTPNLRPLCPARTEYLYRSLTFVCILVYHTPHK